MSNVVTTMFRSSVQYVLLVVGPRIFHPATPLIDRAVDEAL